MLSLRSLTGITLLHKLLHILLQVWPDKFFWRADRWLRSLSVHQCRYHEGPAIYAWASVLPPTHTLLGPKKEGKLYTGPNKEFFTRSKD
jgi:hypothetical protein